MGEQRRRRYYHLTKRGAGVLEILRETVVELHREVVEEAGERRRRSAFHLADRPSEAAASLPARSAVPKRRSSR
jgi:hypothetical protein